LSAGDIGVWLGRRESLSFARLPTLDLADMPIVGSIVCSGDIVSVGVLDSDIFGDGVLPNSERSACLWSGGCVTWRSNEACLGNGAKDRGLADDCPFILLVSRDGSRCTGANELVGGTLALVTLGEDFTGSKANGSGLAEGTIGFAVLGCGRFKICGWKGFSGDGFG